MSVVRWDTASVGFPLRWPARPPSVLVRSASLMAGGAYSVKFRVFGEGAEHLLAVFMACVAPVCGSPAFSLLGCLARSSFAGSLHMTGMEPGRSVTPGPSSSKNPLALVT